MQWTHRELHSDFRRAEPASSYWTMSPSRQRRFAGKHAPKDSNPDRLDWSQPCCQLHQGRMSSAEAARLELANGSAATCVQNRPLIQPDDFQWVGTESNRLGDHLTAIEPAGLQAAVRKPT